MHDKFLNQKHSTFFFIAILDGIFFTLTVLFVSMTVVAYYIVFLSNKARDLYVTRQTLCYLTTHP
jgi:hypothetical protein